MGSASVEDIAEEIEWIVNDDSGLPNWSDI